MTFLPDKTGEFRKIFSESEELIRNFEGCCYLELYQDIHKPSRFFTYSKWQSEWHLENYRRSELFSHVWSLTKPLFSEKAEAWSLCSGFLLP